jgi:transposase
MRQAGLAVELLETRHMCNAFKIMPVKAPQGCSSDCRTDAAGLVPAGALQVDEARETRAMLTARANWCRGTFSEPARILRGFGLKVGKTTPVRFEGRIRELLAGSTRRKP